MPFPLETLDQLQGFFWVLMRTSILFFLMPLFGARGVPTLWKAGLSFVVALVLMPIVPLPATYPETNQEIAVGMLSEAVLGFLLAFGIKMLFASVQIAGQFMSFQMGFAMARAIDPQTGVQSTSLSQFLYLFTILIFFTLDGHHLFIRALAASFEAVPPMGLSMDPSLSHILIKASSQMFVFAIRVAAPIMIALFLSNLCLGIVARTVPQVNILMIGFPINIGIGLTFFGLVLSNLVPFITELTRTMGQLLQRLIQAM